MCKRYCGGKIPDEKSEGSFDIEKVIKKVEKVMGFLTTHVLDTAHGGPAENVRIGMYRVSNNITEHLLDAVTNEDGRCDGEILKDDAFVVGTYELHFHVGDYFRAKGMDLLSPNFLDVVPVRFSVSLAEEHYHVPLLASPFSYTTYRGS